MVAYPTLAAGALATWARGNEGRCSGVSRFETTTADGDDRADLGTVILDGVLPHRDGCSHEIAFHNGSLAVVCRDLVAIWTEADCPDLT